MGTEPEALTSVGEAERTIEEMLLFVAQSLADHPEDVEVEFFSTEDGDVFQIQAHEDDLGRLIGKNGQTARALEAIVNASRRRSGRRYHLDIIGIGEALDEQ